MQFLKSRALQIYLLFIASHSLFSSEKGNKPSRNIKNLVSAVFKIHLKEFPTAWNPSIFEIDEGYILIFRYLPEPIKQPYISYIGAVILNRSFQQITPAELLDVRKDNLFIPSQAEDARIFSYKGDLYVIYNDNTRVMNTKATDRRDMYIAKLSYSLRKEIQNDDDFSHFSLSTPIKLIHPLMYSIRTWEKNWVPFVSDETLFFAYSINPHEILRADLESGICLPQYTTPFSFSWKWGILRGSTPPLLIDGEYLAFFHSGIQLISGASNQNEPLWHYVMGAYTFSSTPPFNVTKISRLPINEKSFYVKSNNPKRVIYPGGFVTSGENIYVAYGKDDCEIWIAVINKNKLLSTLHSTQ